MLSIIKKVIKYIINLPKTVYFNFKILNFKEAIKLPVFVSKDLQIININKNTINIKEPIRTGMIKIGWDDGTPVSPYSKLSIWNVNSTAKIVFNGKAAFARGTTIVAGENSKLILGENFNSNSYCNFFVDKEVQFGDDCLIGWNVSIHDGDGHKIYNNENSLINSAKNVTIGNHVWICADVKILKGASIPNNCIVARNSLVLKKFDKENSIYGGCPSSLLKENIKWQL